MKYRLLIPTLLTSCLVITFVACQSSPLIENPSDGDGDGDGEGDGDGDNDTDFEVPMGGAAGDGDGDMCEEDDGSCEVEPPPPEPACGDGRINVSGETCDDGNGYSGDGCTANCTLEADYVCPTPGEKCVSTVECGDAKVTGNETCDDGNKKSGDGCTKDCQVEAGYACVVPGLHCQAAACGDGLVAGSEECDFGEDIEGCTACKMDEAYDCDASGCALTECGNGKIERGESCEDGNERPFDGCYACALEPKCEGGTCLAVCGDGQRYDSEECDDGNTKDGDGCSAQCNEEKGFVCEDIAGEPPELLNLPVIYRDFIGKRQSLIDTDTCYNPRTSAPTELKPIPCFHVNFDDLSGTDLQNVVETELGPDGTPDLHCPNGDEACTGNPGTATNNFTNNTDFKDWYSDTSPQNIPIFRELTLELDTGLTYSFAPNGGFYPIDDVGWVVSGEEWLRSGSTGNCGSAAHNYSFSTETRFIFEYQGGERFDFNGDDDLWVFVNGKLAIDLAGLHGPRAGYFQLDADEDGDGDDIADGTATVDNPLITEQTIDLGLTVGGIYEVALFHAERNYCGSNFELTLKDFNKPKSTCASICGDGIVASDELCDDGESGNDGSYGKCGVDCRSRGPHCGDGERDKDQGEACDDGVNLSTYGDGCAPGCTRPPSCGDGIVQSTFEDCDDGDNDGGYGECAQGCVLGARCGDGKLDKKYGETCDDGNRTNGDGCNVNCKDENDVIR